MSIKQLLHTTKHRPWDLPTENWKFYQEWNNAIFLHWQVELTALETFVPKALEIDLFEGKPWVSVVAFTMEKIRPRHLPPFPPISNFDEINIRTYVKSNNKTGVYFLSIEGGKKLSCKIAKALSELPYRFSKMKRTNTNYTSKNSEFNDTFTIEYSIEQQLKQKTELDKWLTERYALFQDTNKGINEFEIHHLEWQINKVNLKKTGLNYPKFNTLIKGEPHKTHYSKGVKVIAWSKTKKDKMV